MKKAVGWVLMLGWSLTGYGQLIDSNKHSDCDHAYTIKDSVSLHFKAPTSYGAVKEFEGNGWANLQYPESEHHSVWVTFPSEHDCDLQLTILPDDPNDDYDFMLFQVSNGGGCAEIAKGEVPIRSNFARNKPSYRGKTGLDKTGVSPYVKSGVGNNFSSSFSAKKGSHYLLMVDRVSPKGGPFKLHIDNCYLKSFMQLVKEVYSPVPPVEVAEMPTVDFVAGSFEARPGDVFHLGAVQFYSLQAIAKKGANLQLDSLVSYLELNPSYKVRLHGHTNTDNETSKFTCRVPESKTSNIFSEKHTIPLRGTQQDLSHYRAKSVMNYLTQNGISPDRIETVGWGGTKRQFTSPQNVHERLLNMRVEVEVFK